ncbi:CPBP family intramembrane glutamic endopeptidase [Microbacterium sp. KSW2-21]|uniref:CPBP family intramembrane glutamic endopeptidase n=1 Tax=Microbacterium algihabitans TaxID=3075992 RepID=A0ABU3RVG8_9MICO|nr:CPBP family intramembrane glutamic endopeptidase [Microbacterium sp. KSW2-21]MDU0326868.1 CPBP family intramembrane glutamic endopeptidase [Microbacterium sp. KSW2-21]
MDQDEREQPSTVRGQMKASRPTGRGRSLLLVPRTRVRDWRFNAPAAGGLNATVVAACLVVLGLGAIFASLARGLNCCPTLSTVVFSSSLAIVVGFAFFRSIPRGLFEFRFGDFVVGIAAGIGLRIFYGIISGANSQPFPSADFSGGTVGDWLVVALLTTFFTPTVEELFFRGLLLVSIYRLVRRSWNFISAAVTALLGAVGSFLIVHGAFSSLAVPDILQLTLVAVACGIVVIASGRIWGAVILHATYNFSFLILTAVGALLR